MSSDHKTNSLLSLLSDGDRDSLDLTPVRTTQHAILFDVRQLITAVFFFFPIDAVVSLVIPLSTGEIIETAIVGRDGAIGVSAALDSRVSLSRAVVQISGSCLQCDPNHLRLVANNNAAIRSLLIRHEHALFGQAQQSAACNATHLVEARLAKSLLRAADLHQAEDLPLTQEYIAEMLGVRRTSVSITAHTLQQAGMIRYRRGHIQIIDRPALTEAACECYEAVKANYAALTHASNE